MPTGGPARIGGNIEGAPAGGPVAAGKSAGRGARRPRPARPLRASSDTTSTRARDGTGGFQGGSSRPWAIMPATVGGLGRLMGAFGGPRPAGMPRQDRGHDRVGLGAASP